MLWRRSLTYSLMLVTVLLWGYLIGTYLQMQESLKQMPLPEATYSFEDLQGRQRATATQFHTLPERIQDIDELALFATDHLRYARRDQQFQRRLEEDYSFLLKNSF